jgi:hypothetical protein
VVEEALPRGRAFPSPATFPEVSNADPSQLHLRPRAEEVVDDQVDQLEAREWCDDAAKPVDEQVSPQQGGGADGPVADASQSDRDQEWDHDRVEDDRRDHG